MKVLYKRTGKIETVTDRTDFSFLVTQSKLKETGINCSQWFHKEEFEKRFEVK